MPPFTSELGNSKHNVLVRTFVTLFVGVPMTLGLVLALGFYTMFEILMFAVYPKREFFSSPDASPTPVSDQSFTASLTRLANVHSSSTDAVTVSEEKRTSQLSR